jgi:hypothetical protein
MSTATITRPSLREVILDALNDAFWQQRAEIEDCAGCRKNPAGVCPDRDHQEANTRAVEYDEARKQLERNPEHPEVLSVLAGIGAAPAAGGEQS